MIDMYELEKCLICKHRDECKMKLTFSPLGCSAGFQTEDSEEENQINKNKEKKV